jgi:dienelactone hydrolase
VSGLRRRGWFGLQPSDRPAGVTVVALAPDAPAARAGLRVGDVVTALDGAPVAAARPLRAALATRRAGDLVTLSLADGRALALGAGARPEESHPGLVTRYGEAPAGSFALRTISVAPPGDGPFPTVVFLQGYAAATVERPAAAPASDALGPLVAALARRGLCVWRTEKRGVGDSDGPPSADASFDDETDDHAAGLRAAMAAPWVDRARVTLLGHSLGALHAPLVAARMGGVRAMALYGAGALPWLDYVAENTRRQCALSGMDAAKTDELVAAHLRFSRAVLFEGRSAREVLDADRALDAHHESLGVGDEGRLNGRSVDYWRGVAACEVAAPLVAAGLPTLALWGSSDWLTSRAEHVTLARIVGDAHAGLGAFEEVTGADHGFFAHATPEHSFRAHWFGELHPGVVDAVARFAT